MSEHYQSQNLISNAENRISTLEDLLANETNKSQSLINELAKYTTIDNAMDLIRNFDFYEFIEAFDDGFDWTTLTDIGEKTAQNINEYLAKNDAEIKIDNYT